MKKQFNLSLEESKLTALADSEEWVIEGYATVWNSVNAYGFSIRKGAYTKLLEDGKAPKMFFNHADWDVPIGKWEEMKEDDYGLWVRGKLTKGISKAGDVYTALKAGTLDGLSVGIWFEDQDITDRNEVTRIINLPEISVCSFPADNRARITQTLSFDEVEEKIQGVNTVRDLEDLFKCLGLSNRQATCAVAKAKVAVKGVIHGEHEKQLEELGNKLANFANNL